MKRLCTGWITLLLAVAGTLSLLLVNVDITGCNRLVSLAQAMLGALNGQEAVAALLTLALWALYDRTAFRPYAWRSGDRVKLGVLGLLFAGGATLGAAYRADDGSMAAFVEKLHFVYLGVKALGFFTMFVLCAKALLLNLPKLARGLRAEPAADAAGVRRTFLLAWATLALAWLPAFLARYPGALSADAGRVLQQYTGEIMWTSDHPPFFTLLLGGIVSLGAKLGGDTFGLALYTGLQALGLSAALAFAVAELRREGVPALLRHGLLALYALLPMAMDNAALIIKDIPYAAVFVAYCVLALRALAHPMQARASRGWWGSFGLLSLLLLLLRPNGLMVVAPMALVLLVVFHKCALRGRRLIHLLLVLPVAVSIGFNALVVPLFAYQPETTADTLGITMQQTSRILKNSPQDATAADLAAIDRVLEADKVGPSYSAKSSDPVRKLFRYFNGHTAADVAGYVGAWARLSAAHPLTAIHAAWSLNGGYLDPFDTANTPAGTMLESTSPKFPHTFSFAPPQGLAAVQNALITLDDLYRSLPLVAQLQVVGLYVWLGLLLWFLLSRTKARGLGWALLPLGMTLIACLLSAGFTSGSRYALPIVYAAPWLCCALLPPCYAGLSAGAGSGGCTSVH